MIRPLLTILAVSLVISGCDAPWPGNTFAEEVSAQSSVVEDTAPRVRRILANAESYASPSPDGRYMTFVDWSTGDVAMMEVATEESRRVTDKGTWTENGSWAEEPIFSPDGQRIAYAYGNTRAGIPHRYEIRTVATSGGETSLLYRFDTPDGWAQPVDWGTPGILLEIWFSTKDMGGLALLSADGGEPRMLHELEMKGPHPHEATFSPDGRWIAYRLAGQVYLIRPDGSNRAVLDVAAEALMGWATDGSALILHGDIDGTTAIWSVAVDDGRQVGEPVLVKVGPPALTPAGQAGSRYYYTIRVDVPRLFQSSVDLDEGRMLTPPTQVTSVMDGAASWPSWSPDGTLLAYVHSQPDQSARIMVRSVRNGEVLELAALERARVWNLVWDSSGSQLYYTVTYMGDENTFLESVDVDTGEREEFVLDVDGALFVVPGKRKAVITRQPRDDEGRATDGGLFLHDLATGSELLLRSYPSGLYPSGLLSVSPDEQTIAWVESSDDDGSTFLMAMPLEGGEAHIVAQKSSPEHLETNYRTPIRWSADGSTIFAVTGTSDSDLPHVLNSIPVDGGASTTIDLPEGLYHSISPDGSKLVFVKGNVRREMWVLEGLDSN